MPPEFEEYGRRWAELHPGWEIREWRSSAELPVLATQDLFDAAREVCPRDWKRFQADLLRLELLDQYGGVYVDTDVQPLRPLGPLLAQVGDQAFVPWSPNRGAGGRRLLTQCVLGAPPGHRWIRACIAGIPDAVSRYRGRPLAQMVGPHHVTRVWEQNPQGVTVLDEELFGPQSNRARDRGQAPDLSRSYAWHRWANTRDRRRGGVR
ncbi:Glycosyltransferase sugar-binding region containing DXD motif-containing protein [Streptomyces aidingensis]|uniref:Glycosyltransferase sugar-binding region containing DXD motif-containing protein n=2 Tax=Streptomyces aidingensis TaxID=910347 RepID=A0A1I1Q513_9ACTN|nr:Glycosyltransferase sugar-binding region containing DXD motif-containing protein [Streptomyces aidingensis]